MKKNKSYWIVAREFEGLAEAGGVKGVVCALAKGLHKHGWDVTVIMPLYGCTAIQSVKDLDVIEKITTEIQVDNKIYRVVFCQGSFDGLKVIFVVNTCFTSKMGVYTYTRLEEALNPSLKSGSGHSDASILSVLFQKAVIAFGLLSLRKPDVIHCQDAHTSLIPYLVHKDANAKTFYANTKFFITIHNAGGVYRDQCESVQKASTLLGIPETEFNNYIVKGKPEPFLLSQHFAVFTTVSPWYAEELLDSDNEFCSDISKEFYSRNFKIVGITNGIDYEHYNPVDIAVSTLPFVFNPLNGELKGKYDCRKVFLEKYNKMHTCVEEKKIDRVFQFGVLSSTVDCDKKEVPVYFSFHGRLVHQKGVDVLVEAAKIVMEKRKNAYFIVIGQGTKDLEETNCTLAKTFLGKYIYFQGYDKSLSRLCIAASDFLVLPSFFEPCGLQDFIGQIYGTIPVAHASGGLNKIIHEKTGFLYKKNDPSVLADMLIGLIDRKTENPDCFNSMISYSAKYIKNVYSWDNIIKEKYIPLFNA